MKSSMVYRLFLKMTKRLRKHVLKLIKNIMKSKVFKIETLLIL